MNSVPIVPRRPRCTPTRSRRRARRRRRGREAGTENADVDAIQTSASGATPPRPIAPIQNRREYAPRRIARAASSWPSVGLGVNTCSSSRIPRCASAANASVKRQRANRVRTSPRRRWPRRASQRAAFGRRLRDEIDRAVRALPEIARESLCEQESRVGRRAECGRHRERREPHQRVRPSRADSRRTQSDAMPLCAVSRNAPRASHDDQFGRVRM